MTKPRAKVLKEAVRRVLETACPSRIILFGSAATGRMKSGSDIDLLVLEKKPSDVRKESVRIGDALRGLGIPFDVIVMSEDRFEATKDLVGGIAYPASRYGKVLYAAA